jgi:hypothetical protein
MSDEQDVQPRDAATGQFTAPETINPPALDSYEPLGAPEDVAIEDVPVPTPEEFAADYLTESEKPEPLELKLFTDSTMTEEMPANISVTPEQAGELLSAYEGNIQTSINEISDADLKAALDTTLAQHSPEELKEYGRDPQEVAKNASEQPIEQPLEQQRPDTAVRADANPNDENAEIARALDNPKIRQFLESNLAQAEAAKQQYLQAIEGANRAGLQRLETLLSETNIGKLPTIEARQAAFEDLARTNPHLYVQAQAEMQSIANAQAFQAQHQQAQQAEAQRQFATYKSQQDALFDKAVGRVSRDDVDAVNTYVSDVLKLSPEEAGQLRYNPTATDHRFQIALLDAARYHALKQAPKAYPVRARLPNQRPGAGERAPSPSRLEAKASLTEAEGWELLQQRMRG